MLRFRRQEGVAPDVLDSCMNRARGAGAGYNNNLLRETCPLSEGTLLRFRRQEGVAPGVLDSSMNRARGAGAGHIDNLLLDTCSMSRLMASSTIVSSTK